MHENTVNDITAIIAKDLAFAYPDYSKVFEIYTTAFLKLMGAMIVSKYSVAATNENCTKASTPGDEVSNQGYC